MGPKTFVAFVMVLVIASVAACGGSSSSKSSSNSSTVNPNAPENSPPGDIPDNQAFVKYASPNGYSVKVPEGWSRTNTGGAVVFSDKLNSVSTETRSGAAPTAVVVKKTEVPKLAKSVNGFQNAKVTTVHRAAGPAVEITYLADSKPEPVTGKVTKDAVERYFFSHNGKVLVVTLSGAKGADNVDPWRIVTDSVRWAK